MSKVSKHTQVNHLSKSSNFSIPRYGSNRLLRFMKYHRVKMWISVNENITKLSRNLFNTQLKEYLYRTNKVFI